MVPEPVCNAAGCVVKQLSHSEGQPLLGKPLRRSMGFYQKPQKNTPDEPELWAQGVSVASFTKQLLHTCLAEISLASQFYPLSEIQLCASRMSIRVLLSLLDLSILGAFLSRCNLFLVVLWITFLGVQRAQTHPCSEGNCSGMQMGFSLASCHHLRDVFLVGKKA